MTASKKSEMQAASTIEAEAGDEGVPSLLELVVAEEQTTAPLLASRIDGVVVARLVALDPSGAPRVMFAGAAREGVTARAVVSLKPEDVGREVALMFEGGDPQRPLVMGCMVSPVVQAAEGSVDGERVEINAEREIVLRCGESSITLTRAGKILICGAYVLTRATGVNRVQGASVEIN
jgi:hypothetical protein